MHARPMATKSDQPLCSTATRYAHIDGAVNRSQGIPISSCEPGVARSVFDAQWFVKQPFMSLPQRAVWRVVDPPRNLLTLLLQRVVWRVVDPPRNLLFSRYRATSSPCTG